METYHFQHFQRKNLYLILVYTLNLSLATISSQIQPNLSMRSPLLSSHMYAVTSIKQSHVFQGHLLLSCHRTFHRSRVL
jgi:hypothetical protein